jgi:hypothetical protein
MIDLRNCKKGDKLISKHGETLKYVKHQPEEYFPHRVEYADGSGGSQTDNGFVMHNDSRRLETDHDIVKVIPLENKQMREGKPTIDDMRQDLADQEADNLQHSDIVELLLNGFEGLENMNDIDIRDEWTQVFGDLKTQKTITL